MKRRARAYVGVQKRASGFFIKRAARAIYFFLSSAGASPTYARPTASGFALIAAPGFCFFFPAGRGGLPAAPVIEIGG